MAPLALMRCDDRAYRLDRRIEPLGNVAVGGLEPPGARGDAVELCCELRPVRSEHVHLLAQPRFALLRFQLALTRSLERIQRNLQSLDRGLDAGAFAHHLLPEPTRPDLATKFVGQGRS